MFNFPLKFYHYWWYSWHFNTNPTQPITLFNISIKTQQNIKQKRNLQTSVDVSHVVTHHSTKSPQNRLTSQFGMGYGAFVSVWTFVINRIYAISPSEWLQCVIYDSNKKTTHDSWDHVVVKVCSNGNFLYVIKSVVFMAINISKTCLKWSFDDHD